MPSLPIVFIGPMAAGKSTLSKALATRLGARLVPLDAVRWYYHLEDGYDFTAPEPEGGFPEIVRGWEPFSIAAVERALEDFPGSVFDFGAGHAHFEDPARVDRLEQALSTVAHVVLVLPHADLDATEQLCNQRDQERGGSRWSHSRDVMNRTFIHSEVFRRVATHTVFVEGRAAEQVVDELMAQLL